jgi:hypothetical protein
MIWRMYRQEEVLGVEKMFTMMQIQINFIKNIKTGDQNKL